MVRFRTCTYGGHVSHMDVDIVEVGCWYTGSRAKELRSCVSHDRSESWVVSVGCLLILVCVFTKALFDLRSDFAYSDFARSLFWFDLSVARNFCSELVRSLAGL